MNTTPDWWDDRDAIFATYATGPVDEPVSDVRVGSLWRHDLCETVMRVADVRRNIILLRAAEPIYYQADAYFVFGGECFFDSYSECSAPAQRLTEDVTVHRSMLLPTLDFLIEAESRFAGGQLCFAGPDGRVPKDFSDGAEVVLHGKELVMVARVSPADAIGNNVVSFSRRARDVVAPLLNAGPVDLLINSWVTRMMRNEHAWAGNHWRQRQPKARH